MYFSFFSGFDDKYVHWGAAKRMMEENYKLSRDNVLSIIFSVLSKGFLKEKTMLRRGMGHTYLLPKKDLDDSKVSVS